MITSFQQRKSRAAVRYYKSKPLYVCLSSAVNITDVTSFMELLATELSPSDGYIRKRIIFDSDGQFNITNNRHELIGTVEFRPHPLGSSWQFQSAFVVEDGGESPGLIIPASNINTQYNRIDLPNHGQQDGKRLIFTPDVMANLFSIAGEQVSPQTIYQVINSTAGNFQIAQLNSTSPLDITNSGSGNMIARNANGEEVFFLIETEQINLLPGQPYVLTFPLYFF